MKLRFASLVFAFAFVFTVGCKSQETATPILTCPPATGTYAVLNATNLATGSTYKDTTPGAGSVIQACYVAQTHQNGGISQPSNIVGPVTVPVGLSVQLSWTPPANCTGCTYSISRIAAIQTFPTAPNVNQNPTESKLAIPGDPLIAHPTELVVASLHAPK